jgi:hypothetical protein
MPDLFKTAYITTSKKFLAHLFILLSATTSAPVTQTGPEFRRVTVEEILEKPKKFDGVKVELHGRITLTQETSVFRDESTCSKLRIKTCAIWFQLDPCDIVGIPIKESCNAYITKATRNGDGSRRNHLTVIDNITIRAVVTTTRKDLRYDKSVPRSARVGMFGHLGAYGAQVNASQIEPKRGQPVK